MPGSTTSATQSNSKDYSPLFHGETKHHEVDPSIEDAHIDNEEDDEEDLICRRGKTGGGVAARLFGASDVAPISQRADSAQFSTQLVDRERSRQGTRRYIASQQPSLCARARRTSLAFGAGYQPQMQTLGKVKSPIIGSPGDSYASTRTPLSVRDDISLRSWDIGSPKSRSSQTSHESDSYTPQWSQLEMIGAPLPTTFWIDLFNKMNTTTENWRGQCQALVDIRRVAYHCANALQAPAPATARCCVITSSSGSGSRPTLSLANGALQKVLALAESLRSLVSRAAFVALHDLFLFATEHIDSQLAGEALIVCLKKAAAGGFIADEAARTWKQIALVTEPLRIMTALSGVLGKHARNNAGLRTQCIQAACFFALRLNAQSLRSVINHREFPSHFLKPIIKAASDSNQDCRTAASQCLVVYFNMIPDLLQRYRHTLIDVDIAQLITRIRKAEHLDLKITFGIPEMIKSYKLLPEYVPVDLSLERLQTVLSNIDEILNYPLSMASPNSKSHESPDCFRYSRRLSSRTCSGSMRPHLETVATISQARLSPDTKSQMQLLYGGGVITKRRPKVEEPEPEEDEVYPRPLSAVPARSSQFKPRSPPPPPLRLMMPNMHTVANVSRGKLQHTKW